MRLVRYATVDLTRPAPQDQPLLTYRATNGIEVAVVDVKGLPLSPGPETTGSTARVVFPYEHDSLRLVVSATAEGGAPSALAGRLVVPETERQMAESAIQELADFLAVAHQCKRTLRSPQPAIALLPSDEAERRVFAASDGLAQPAGAGGAEARVFSAFDPGRLALFTDRMDGLAMLADSLSEDTALGRVRELLRLFERAFRRGPSDCIDPLTALLSQAPRHDATQYSKEEGEGVASRAATSRRPRRSSSQHGEVGRCRAAPRPHRVRRVRRAAQQGELGPPLVHSAQCHHAHERADADRRDGA